MVFFHRLRRRHILSLLLLVFLVGMGAGWFSNHVFFNEDFLFQQYTQEIFRSEVGSNTLNLHYTLAHPEKAGLENRAVSLGNIGIGDDSTYGILENYEAGIRRFSYDKLSEENQITYDTLLLYYHTLQKSSEYELLQEILNPGLGLQAQLPVLLAEYSFYNKQDVEDYLTLLSQMDTYFQSILEFEQEKSSQGYFMNDECLEGILEQCKEFIASPEENYLLDIFQDKVGNLSFLNDSEREHYIAENKRMVTEHVIPAYELLMAGLSGLKGTCTNEKGLCYFPKGKEYYAYLLKTQVGVYETPESILQRLQTQLLADYEAFGKLLEESPGLLADTLRSDYQIESPQDALSALQTTAWKDFPELKNVDYEVKYVHSSLEDYLSPAFYLTPPIDTETSNLIYINQASRSSDIELFATLGHEGFPGHLYQNQFFLQSQPAQIRHVPDFGGYVEGWATYVEAYAYSYAEIEEPMAKFLWLNRSINLCLYSLVDMGVHYYGWGPENTMKYLQNFGITNEAVIHEIYQLILENPANYLKYYVGYLQFLDLKTEMQALQGDSFDLKEFHRQILEIGPTQFPVLRKHMGLALD